MGLKNIIPDAFIEMGAQSGTLPVVHLLPAMQAELFKRRETQIRHLGVRDRELVESLCSIIAQYQVETIRTTGNFSMRVPVDSDRDNAALEIYSYAVGRHAFKGTVFLALLDMVREQAGSSVFQSVRQTIFEARKDNPFAWELVRNLGRPSVSESLVAVFAVYEAEKTLGRPLNDLSTAMQEVLGLI